MSETAITTSLPRRGLPEWRDGEPGFYTVNPWTNIGNFRFFRREDAENWRDEVMAKYAGIDSTPLVVVEVP